MKDGYYLSVCSYTYYGLDLGDVYERELSLESGLVLTDDGRSAPPRSLGKRAVYSVSERRAVLHRSGERTAMRGSALVSLLRRREMGLRRC